MRSVIWTCLERLPDLCDVAELLRERDDLCDERLFDRFLLTDLDLFPDFADALLALRDLLDPLAERLPDFREEPEPDDLLPERLRLFLEPERREAFEFDLERFGDGELC